MDTITNRIEFPRDTTPEPDFDLEITNRTLFDHEEDGAVSFGNGLAAESDPPVEPSYFPFADKPASLLAKPDAPTGTQGKDYSLPEVLGHWDSASYTTVQNALRKISSDKFVKVKRYEEQTEAAKDEYLREAIHMFPFIDGYPSGWPAVEFAKMYLKNASSLANKKAKEGS